MATSLAVLQWRPMAVSWLTDDSSKQRCCCFKRRKERLLLFPLSSSVSFFFLFFRCQVVSLFVLPALLFISLSNPPLFQTRLSLSLSLSLSPICFPFLFLSFSFHLFSPLVLALGGIYRAKGVGASLSPPYCCVWGAGLSCPATTPG